MAAVEITTVADLTKSTLAPTVDGIHVTDKSTNLFKEITGTELLKGAGITTTNLVEYASLSAAITAISTTPTHLVIANDASISADLTIPATCRLRFMNGAKITIAATKTLTINALHDPGDVQIVSLAASSSLVRFGKDCGRINIAWICGGVGTTGTDATNALDNACASMTANGGGRTLVPLGGYTSSSTHAVTLHSYIDGFHSYGSQITHTVSDRPLFRTVSGARYFGATNISLVGVCGPGTTSVGWSCEPDGNVDGLAFGTFQGVSINGFNRGFSIHATDSTYGGQCVGIDFDNHCQFLSNDTNIFVDTPNTNIVNHALMQVSFDLVNNYAQLQADFDRMGMYLATGEHTGQAKGTCTFTAVAATDVCTGAARNGFYTGMAFSFSNSGGALPTGLSASTTYYCIPIDNVAGTFYVASSYANAYAGTHIDITGAGTGTQTLTCSGVAAYGNFQTETQTIKSTDAVTVAGTAIATFRAACMYGDGVSAPAGGTFTAVAATDICTLAAHGFYTGLIVRGSTTGALPTGLSVATDYYAIPIDANTFYLASTLTNCLAGTHIDITGAGSGTNTITPQASALGSPVNVNIPLNATTHTSAAAIADAVREAVMANPFVSSTFHCGYIDGSPNECRAVFQNTGKAQVTTAYLGGTPSTGNITWVITLAGMTGSPLSITAAVLTGDTLNQAAIKSAAALNANASFAAKCFARTVTTQDAVIIETKDRNAHDATFNAAFSGAGTAAVAGLSASVSVTTTRGEAANDTIANFALDPNGVVGMTRDATYSKATSVRTNGLAHHLPQGYRFNGGHEPTVFQRTVDEGIENFIINDADQIESAIIVDNCDIQGNIRLNRACAFTGSGRFFDRTIQDGGSDLATYYGGSVINVNAVVPYYSNFHMAAGNAVMLLNGRKTHNFSNIAGDARSGGMSLLDVQPQNRRVLSDATWAIYANEDSINYSQSRPPMTLGVDKNYQFTSTAFALAAPAVMEGDNIQATSVGNKAYYHRYAGNYSGHGPGVWEITGGQDGYSAINLLNGPMYARGFHGLQKTPADISADANDWSPTFNFDYSTIRANPYGADRSLTGMAAPLASTETALRDGYSGRFINISDTYSLVIKHESGSSMAANRFHNAGGRTLIIRPGEIRFLEYDLTLGRWVFGEILKGLDPVEKSAAYTTTFSDADRLIIHPETDATARTFTIDSDANTPQPLGTFHDFENRSSQLLTIAVTSDTLKRLGRGSTGSFTVKCGERVRVVKTATTTWEWHYIEKNGAIVARVDIGRNSGVIASGWVPEGSLVTSAGSRTSDVGRAWVIPNGLYHLPPNTVLDTIMYGSSFEITFTGLKPGREYVLYAFSAWNTSRFDTQIKMNGDIMGTLLIGTFNGVSAYNVLQGIYVHEADETGSILVRVDGINSQNALINALALTE